MILFLDLHGEASLSARQLEAIENLAASGINGYQFVTGTRRTLDELSREPKLSSRARSYFRKMSQQMTQVGNQIANLDRLLVTFEAPGNPDVPSISLDTFCDASYCEKTQLLAENLTDFDVLTGLSKILLAKDFRGLQLSLRAQNGGGSTTPQVLLHLAETPSGPIVCVVDSDRKFPGGALGSTAKTTLRDLKKACDRWRVRVHVIEQRELENILPFDLRRHCSAGLSKDLQDQLAALDAVDAFYSHYCCLKEGYSQCTMIGDLAAKRRPDLLQFARNIAYTGLPKVVACGTCQVPGGCFSSPALGKNLLQRAALELKSNSSVTSISNWCADLLRIINAVVVLGLAPLPQRI